jgi:very-short-patch-repair endonuclease
MKVLQSPASVLLREQGKAKRQALEAKMLQALKAYGLTRGMEREHRFFESRGWRFDFAWPEHQLALEVEGGTWRISRHTSGEGFEEDCEKYATAVIAGWRVLRVTSRQVSNGQAINWVQVALAQTTHPAAQFT